MPGVQSVTPNFGPARAPRLKWQENRNEAPEIDARPQQRCWSILCFYHIRCKKVDGQRRHGS